MAGRNIPDLDLLTEQWEPKVRKAFLDSIDGITDRAKIAELARLIERQSDATDVLRRGLCSVPYGESIDAARLASVQPRDAFREPSHRVNEYD